MDSSEVGSSASPAPATTGTRGLSSLAFIGLALTQFLTAVNDNVFRWLVIGIGKDHASEVIRTGNGPSCLTEGNILMAGTAAFVFPYLILAAPAGYFADRYRKRSVIVACKVAEILVMLLAVGAVLMGKQPGHASIGLLLSVLALMGAQSALFAPSRSGSIPELLRPERVSMANGIFALVTVAATIIGMVIGLRVKDIAGEKGLEGIGLIGSVLVGIAAVGTITSLFIPAGVIGDATRKFPWDAPIQTFRDLKRLFLDKPLLRVALGILFFYSIGAIAQLNIDQLAAETGAQLESAKVPLLLALIGGVCLGSILAGTMSGEQVELGLLPLGTLGMAICSGLLFTVPHDLFEASHGTFTWGLAWSCFLLACLGVSAGLFSVPLESYMQQHSPPEARGSILAANNFMTFAGILGASLLFAVLRMPIGTPSADGNVRELCSPQTIFLLAGVATIPVMLYILYLLPQATIRMAVWLLTRTVYRMRIVGRENMPLTGGALLVPNHITWIDAALLYASSSRPIRMVALSSNLENRWVKWFSNICGTILINPAKPKMIVTAFKTAREALNRGEIVCIFPEGGLTRNGQVQAFRPGTMKILEGTTAPVIPIYLDGLWGSIFSFSAEKFFWKWPKRVPYPMALHFGKPLQQPTDIHQMRQAVLDLSAQAVTERANQSMNLITRSFIRSCKKRKKVSKVADSLGSDVTGGELLTRALILRRMLNRHVLKAGEKYIGILLPPSMGAFTANMAIALDRKVAVNLNYTVTSEVMNACIKQADIKHVLTTRQAMEKFNLKLDAELVYLEDFKEKVTSLDKLLCAAAAYAVPASLLEWWLGLGKVKASDVLTVIFTSGSTGTPKGVMLTYANIGSNVEAIDQAIHLRSSDVLIGILPFFHSFGYTVTMWGVAGLDIKGIYHFSPLDARQIGKLAHKHGGTLLLSTPTFMRTYVRRIDPEEFATLDVAVCGAEKLPRDLSDEFEAKFKVRPVEGYGTTELSPLVSVNIPPSRSIDNFQKDRVEGSVGRTIPGVSAKITHLETGAPCGAGESGMLWIKGPNVMAGYMHQPELTSQVIKDGWYMTGDVAFLDDEGFIHITGRESRFSKIGGEMVPHIKIEEDLCALITPTEDGLTQIAVTAVPDEKKGERLIVLYTQIDKSIDELRKGLTDAGLPNLFIPSADSFLQVPKIPVLGTGKLDLKGVKQMALELTKEA